MTDEKKPTPSGGRRKRLGAERDSIVEAARRATEDTAPSPEALRLLLGTCDGLAERFAAYAMLLQKALGPQAGPQTRALVDETVASTIHGVERVVEGMGNATLKAKRIYLIDLIENAADLRRTPNGSPNDKPALLLRRTLVLANPQAYVRTRLALVAPDLANMAADDVLTPALAACEAARPGKRGVSKWKVLSEAWWKIAGEKIVPGTMQTDQSNPRESPHMKP